MKLLKLGQTDILVSQMCLGCLYFGARDDKRESFLRLDQFVAAGGNFLDSANMYSHWLPGNNKGGESELVIGEWVRARGNRSKLVIATKMGFPYPGVAYGTSKKQIVEECDKSLMRLGIDYIDLYYAHTDDPQTPMEETLSALNALVAAGKVRAIGASNFKAWRLERARQISIQNNFAQYCCIQQRHSYLRPKTGWSFDGQIAANEDLFEYVRDTGIALLAYSPLLYGTYTNAQKTVMEQYQGPDSDARRIALDEISIETGATRNQLVYYWLMHANPPAIPLIASSSSAQFNEAIGTLSLSLSKEQMTRLNHARF